jgi:hypothetical protein
LLHCHHADRGTRSGTHARPWLDNGYYFSHRVTIPDVSAPMVRDQTEFAALLFPRQLFGMYGFGSVEIAEEGITFRWSGLLIRAKPEMYEWDKIELLRMRGATLIVKLEGHRIRREAHVWRSKVLRRALEARGHQC